MAEIRVKDNESLDSALRRFKKQCARAGVIQEVRKREAYEKPSVKRKKSQKQLASGSISKGCSNHVHHGSGLYARFFVPTQAPEGVTTLWDCCGPLPYSSG